MLKHLFQHGIQCFSVSETLHNYSRLSIEFNPQLNINSTLVHDVLQISSSSRFSFAKNGIPKLCKCLHDRFKTEMYNDTLIYFISIAHMCIPQIPYSQPKHNNKQRCLPQPSANRITFRCNSRLVDVSLFLLYA